MFMLGSEVGVIMPKVRAPGKKTRHLPTGGGGRNRWGWAEPVLRLTSVVEGSLLRTPVAACAPRGETSAGWICLQGGDGAIPRRMQAMLTYAYEALYIRPVFLISATSRTGST